MAPELVRLAGSIEGAASVITWDDLEQGEVPEWDVQMELTDLPYLFRATPEALGAGVPFLHLPQASLAPTEAALEKLEGGRKHMRIGLCWECVSWELDRAIDLEDLGKLRSFRFHWHYWQAKETG